MVRAGMTYLIAEWRRMVNDRGTAVWTDEEAQAILDRHAVQHVNTTLTPLPAPEDGTVVWRVYVAPGEYWEGPESGTEMWRVTDAQGTVIGTAEYDVDLVHGVITFHEDQKGSARYLTARQYDIYSAAGDGWMELASMKAEYYDFAADGAKFNREQWFEHCLQMANMYYRQGRPGLTRVYRGDILRESPFADVL